MITVCAKRGKECWSFPNSKLGKAVAFARIGSQTGTERTVTLCGKRVRVYRKGKKVSGSADMPALRSRARGCAR